VHRGGEGRASDRSVVSLSEGDAVGSTPGGGGPNRHAPQQIAGCAPRCARFSKRVAGATGSPRIHPDLRETDVCVSRNPTAVRAGETALCATVLAFRLTSRTARPRTPSGMTSCSSEAVLQRGQSVP